MVGVLLPGGRRIRIPVGGLRQEVIVTADCVSVVDDVFVTDPISFIKRFDSRPVCIDQSVVFFSAYPIREFMASVLLTNRITSNLYLLILLMSKMSALCP